MTNTVSKMVSDETLDCIIQIESAGRPTAKAPTSSALGLGQFLSKTWLTTVERHRPDLMTGRSNSEVLALRTDPSLAVEMLARFTEDNMKIVGRDCSPGDLYLAHFLGSGAARAVYRAGPTQPVEPLVGDAAVRANRSILQGKTCGEVRAWAGRKMAQSGGRGWVKKYYKPKRTLVMSADPAEVDRYTGDADLRDLQADLKDMNYNPGVIDGKWGGNTAGAVSGFINDRGGFISAPTSRAQYEQVYERLRAEIDTAMQENFVRPVSKLRKSDDVKKVAQIAPEVVPVSQAVQWTFRGLVTALVTAAGDFAMEGWNWLTANKDSIPTDPGTLQTYWGYVQAVPRGFWILLIAGALAAIYWKSRQGQQQIIDAVNTGERT